MKPLYLNTSSTESSFTLLESLSTNNKFELISKLSKSMKTEKKTSEKSFKSLFGAIEIEQSAVCCGIQKR